jgi:hypothetical protein
MNVRQILGGPEREWDAKPPASEAEITLLNSNTRAELSPEYLELLRVSDGGAGPLALPPLWFRLYPVKDCIELCHRDQQVCKQFPSFMHLSPTFLLTGAPSLAAIGPCSPRFGCRSRPSSLCSSGPTPVSKHFYDRLRKQCSKSAVVAFCHSERF